eukprot:1369863-Rhodomonas_salina.1
MSLIVPVHPVPRQHQASRPSIKNACGARLNLTVAVAAGSRFQVVAAQLESARALVRFTDACQ